MKITKEHALFYASKKSKLFTCNVSIHALINAQTKLDKNLIDKHNDLQLLKMIYQRAKRNKQNLIAELTRVELSGYSKNRTRLFRKCRLKLSKINS